MSFQNISISSIANVINKFAIVDSLQQLYDQNGNIINLYNNNDMSGRYLSSNILANTNKYSYTSSNITFYNINYLKNTSYKYGYSNTDTKSIFETYLKNNNDIITSVTTLTKKNYVGLQKTYNFGNCYNLLYQNISTTIAYNNIVKVVCSAYHSVFLENTGYVLACGYNTSGYGITGTSTIDKIEWYPTYVLDASGIIGSKLNNIVNIVCSINHTVFLQNTGNVLACGYNFGEMGTSMTGGTEMIPKFILDTSGNTGSKLSNIVNIFCSMYHTIFLENTGNVLACGFNGSVISSVYGGITGTSTGVGIQWNPKYVLDTSGTAGSKLANIVNITCSQYHTIFLENTGKVLACGYNDANGGGITGTSNISGIQWYPKYVLDTSGTAGSKLANIVNITCSSYHTIFLENTGNVLACGYNNANGLGITGTSNISGIQWNPKYVLATSGTAGSKLANIVNITCSQYHTIFLENTGNVLACGYNNANGGGITGTSTGAGIQLYPKYVLDTSGTAGSKLANIVNITCSSYHTIFLENTGNVLACGYNNANGLGITGTSNISGIQWYPKYVLDTSGTTGSKLDNIVNVVCSQYHTIFLKNKGNAVACGYNNNTSGYGITGTSNLSGFVWYPNNVKYIQIPITYNYVKKSIIKVFSNLYTAFFLENNGNVLACGRNTNGAGITGTQNTDGIINIPSYVLGFNQNSSCNLNNITNVFCSEFNAVFLQNTGNVLACGNNNSVLSSVGITGTRTSSGIVMVPEYIIGSSQGNMYLKNIINVSCNYYHTIFLEKTGNVLGCGYTWYGTVGISTSSIGNSFIPRYVLNVTGEIGSKLANIVNIFSSKYHSIFLENTGSVSVCGYYFYCALGLGQISSSVYYPNYVIGTNQGNTYLKNIIHISCSYRSTFFLENTGKVLACGENSVYSGITGTNIVSAIEYIPAYVLGTNQGNAVLCNIVKVVCGEYSATFLENTGSVLACGINTATGVGITGTQTTAGIEWIPAYVLGSSQKNKYLNNIINIFCSDWHTIFLENTGRVLACGFNNTSSGKMYGITGTQASNGSIYIPAYVLGNSQNNLYLNNIVDVFCTALNTFFTENTGKILGCGNNILGQGPIGTHPYDTTIYIPQYVQNINNGISDFIPGNNCYFCIENSNMTSNVVRANFNNDYGKLGIINNFGTNITSNIYSYANYIDKYVVNDTGTGLLSNVKTIACGNYHTLFLLNNGNVYSCGYNNYGQLGLATYSIQTIGKPAGVSNGTNIKAISCGLYHSVILNNLGDAYSCGLNNYGQLGIGNNNNYNIPTKISVAGVTFSDVECGGWHTVLQTTTNTAYGTGLNTVGQLGTANTVQYTTPIQVKGLGGIGNLTNINFIRCGQNFTIYTLTTNTNNIYMSGQHTGTAFSNLTPSELYSGANNIKIEDIYTNIFSNEIYVKMSIILY